MGGTVSTENRFIVSGCSPAVKASNSQVNPNSFAAIVLNKNFTGDIEFLKPLPINVEVGSNKLFDRIFTYIIRGKNSFLNFTMSFNDVTKVGSIVSSGNTKSYLVIEGNLAKNIPDVNCGFQSTTIVVVPYITRAIVIKTIPGFITQGDVYTITVFVSGATLNESLYDFYINVEITRPKSSNINASS